VQAPHEQGNTAHQVKKNNASHRAARLVSMRVPLRSRQTSSATWKSRPLCEIEPLGGQFQCHLANRDTRVLFGT
jgi:hypothetical protein